MEQFGDVHLQQSGFVTVCEVRRPPYNFFGRKLIASLADAFEYLDEVAELASEARIHPFLHSA